MNILFVSENLVKGSHSEDIEDSIKAYSNHYQACSYMEEYLAKGKATFESNIIRTIQEGGFDVICFAIGFSRVLDPAFILLLGRTVKVIIMFPDSEHLFEINDRYYAQVSDLTVLFSPATVYLFKLYGLNAIFNFGFSSERYFKKQRNKNIDVSFVGGLDRSDRVQMLEFLEENGVDVHTYGHKSKNGMISNEQKNEVVWSSKINLNFTGVSQQGKEGHQRNILERIKQAKGRPMEVAMCGGFILSEYAPGLEEMFEIGKEIDVFYTREEMLEKVKFYLANDDIREEMAARAHERALADYENKKSFKKVLLALETSKPAVKTLFIDKEFAQLFTSARIYYGFRFLSKFMFSAFVDELVTAMKYGGFRFRNIYYDAPRGIFHELDYRLNFIGKVARLALGFIRNKSVS